MKVVRTAIGRTLSQLAKAQTRLRRIEPSLDTDAFVPMQGLAPGNGVGWPSLRSGRGSDEISDTPAAARAEQAAARSWFPGFRAEPVGD